MGDLHEFMDTWSSAEKRLKLVDEVYEGKDVSKGPLISWEKIPKTNIRIIDFDHFELLKLINKLAVEVDLAHSDKVIGLTVSQFNNYAIEHFRREEALMRAVGYAGFREHRKKHLAFRQYFHAVAILQANDPAALDYGNILEFLGAWLRQHVSVSDLDYVQCIKDTEHSPDSGAVFGPLDTKDALADYVAIAEEVLMSGSKFAVDLSREILDAQAKAALDIDIDTARRIVDAVRVR